MFPLVPKFYFLIKGSFLDVLSDVISHKKIDVPAAYLYSFLSNKRRVANKRRVWKKCQSRLLGLNPINEGSGTNGRPGIFVRLL